MVLMHHDTHKVVSLGKGPVLLVFLLFLSITWLLFFAINAQAAQVTLAWNASTGSSIAGYKLYYGTVSGNYAYYVDVGNTTSYTLSGLSAGATYYLAATDYDSSGNQSGYSNQVSYTVPSGSCTYSISPAGVSVSASGATGSISVTTQNGCTWTASSGASWMSITAGSTGTGSGTVSYSIAANTASSSRTAASTVAGLSFAVTQAAAAAAQKTYTIVASAGTGGSISPSGSVSVNSGASQSFSVTARSGYVVSSVAVDGKSVGKVSSYTFNGVTANHTIKATFSYRRR